MKFIYLDEAGNTGRKLDPDQPHHLIAAVLVDADKVPEVERTMRRLAAKHCGHNGLVGEIEFHGYEIRAGKGAFKRMAVERRIEVMRDIISIIQAQKLMVGYVSIDKMKTWSSKHPHEFAFMFLVERLQDVLKAESRLGLIVADEHKDVEQKLIEDLDKYKQFDTNWGYRPTKAENIIDSIHFVSSRNNWLIQLADVVASVILRGNRVAKELADKYIAVGRPSDYSAWTQANASPQQAVDLELFRALGPMRFAKRFPE